MAKRIRITKNKELQKKMIQDFKDGYSILALADKYKAATSTVIKILKSELKDEYKKIINDKKRRKNIINIPKVSDKTVNESYKQSIFKYFNVMNKCGFTPQEANQKLKDILEKSKKKNDEQSYKIQAFEKILFALTFALTANEEKLKRYKKSVSLLTKSLDELSVDIPEKIRKRAIDTIDQKIKRKESFDTFDFYDAISEAMELLKKTDKRFVNSWLALAADGVDEFYKEEVQNAG